LRLVAGVTLSLELLNSKGQVVRLGREFARGGEGAIYEIEGHPALVAKKYLHPLRPDKSEKLRVMPSLGTEDLLKFAAWPVDTLHVRPGAEVVGMIMPRVNGYREVHQLYGPGHRRVLYPKADWSFLVHVAMNCAAAFDSVHSKGHVIGDVNQSGVLVSAIGTVFLIDCDSFQIKHGGRVFRCEVGVPLYTPPELQGKDFATLERTVTMKKHSVVLAALQRAQLCQVA
jgi:DNA-binding helix-hairpin-helix protein with protein kinase domain